MPPGLRGIQLGGVTATPARPVQHNRRASDAYPGTDFLLAINGYMCYRLALIAAGGNSYNRARFERMCAPIVGDLVLETSTIRTWMDSGKLRTPVLGWLVRTLQEPVSTQEELNEMHAGGDYWVHDAETRAEIPTEQVWYIQSFDGMTHRWTDADFVAIPRTYEWQ